MELQIILFGIARDIVGNPKLKLTLHKGASIGVLKKHLTDNYPEMARLKSISFAVGTDYVNDNYELSDKEEIIIIPPVSGG